MMPGAEALALGLKYAVGGSALFAEVLIAACLFAHGQPTRQHPIARAVAAVGLLFATELLTSFLAGTRSTDDGSLVVLNIDASYPLSLGIIGGLVTCTAFLLVTIPTLLEPLGGNLLLHRRLRAPKPGKQHRRDCGAHP